MSSSSIYASVDFLNWQVARSNLEFVHKNNPAIPASVVGVGETIGVDHSYTGGFRLGLGRRSCSGWDYGATYTSFDASVTEAEMDKHFDLNVSGCVPVGPPPLGGGGVDAHHHAALLRLGAMATLR